MPANASDLAGGEIRGDAAYALAEFCRRTGIRRAGMRSLRREGLIVRRAGRLAFVIGADWIDFLRRVAGGGQ